MMICSFTIVNTGARVAERLRNGLQIHLSRFDSRLWLKSVLINFIRKLLVRKFRIFTPGDLNKSTLIVKSGTPNRI